MNCSFVLLVAAVLVAVGCGGNGNATNGTGGGNSLSVTSTMPASGGTSIATSSGITASFSSDMNAATLTGLTFKASSSSGPIAGMVTCSTNTAEFHSTNSLPANTLITVVATTGSRDQAGASLKSNYSWTFTTGGAVDPAPPIVNSVDPTSGATGVPVKTLITVYFDKQMDPATLNASTITLQGPNGMVAGKVSAQASAAVFTPSTSLAYNSGFTVTVTSGVHDLSGNAMTANYVSTFTTGTSSINPALTVSSTNPLRSATGVPLNAKISVLFSEPLDPQTVNSNTFVLEGPSGQVAGTVTSLDNVAVFTPNSALSSSELFTATVKVGIHDLSGKSMATNWAWSFTTAATVDSTRPVIVTVAPAASSINIPTNESASVTFSKVMDPTTLNPTSMIIKQANGVVVSAPVSYAGSTAVINPTSNFSPDSVYSVTVTTGVADTSGNHLAANQTWSFTTAAVKDTTPPTVISTNPANKSTNVFLNKSINATFSEGMQAPTISTSTFIVAGVQGTVSFNTTSNIATFKPNANLSPNTTYTASIGVGVKDTAGNNLAKQYTWTFTTGIQVAQNTINLGSASTYAVLAGSTVTNAGPTILTGDVGISPGTAATGFPPGIINGNLEAGNAVAAKAKADLLVGQLDAAGRLGAATLPGDLSGLTFTPGLYKNSTSVMLSTGNVTLDAQGDASAVFIFQIGSTLTTSPGTQVVLAGGAQASNIYWSVGSSATIGVNSVFKGIVLAQASITVNTGAVNTGTFLTNIGAVTLQSNTVTRPAIKLP